MYSTSGLQILAGSKNALRGAGFFLGGALLSLFGFRGAVLGMGLALVPTLQAPSAGVVGVWEAFWPYG